MDVRREVAAVAASGREDELARARLQAESLRALLGHTQAWPAVEHYLGVALLQAGVLEPVDAKGGAR